MEKYRVGLLGFGTVGSGAVKTLLENRDIINARAGREIELAALADIDLVTDRGVDLGRFPGLKTTKDAREVLAMADIDVVVETIGGMKIAREMVLGALEAGKDVVTANKALLAEHAGEIFSAAKKNGCRILFEGAVGGGIPIIETLDGPLSSCRVERMWGILNGTCNYILTRMEKGEGSFEAVLREAQNLGYAEADPSLDVDGFDTAHKIALLASMCFGQKIDYERIPVEGISRIEDVDTSFAAFNGYRIKLLGVAQRVGETVDVRVHPALVDRSCLLTGVDEVFNALYLATRPAGGMMLYGRGAGDLPTGSAVVSDIIQLARGENSLPSHYDGFLAGGLPAKNPDEVTHHYYFRCTVAESLNVVNETVAVLAAKGILIDMVERVESGGYKVVLLTGEISRKTAREALKALRETAFVIEEPYAIPIEQVEE
jgi:homoserine dehydrogenase